MKSIDYINMMPLKENRIRLPEQANTSVQALSKKDEFFAIYLHRNDTVNMASTLEIDLPSGSYKMTWTDTKNGVETSGSLNDHKGGNATIVSPEYSEDIALRVIKAD